ncbi:hypothetical protein AB0J38_25715 [Streptomyces sp. NPDC050095]|uniref:glycine-rich domain-containing protein n=1 Tax=unclassified Streptomyces TaxID=2593676 RepID=UPI00342BD3D3
MSTPSEPQPMPGPPNPGPIPVMARMLLDDITFESCRKTVLDANPDMAADLAGQIVDEGLKFVAACATNPGVPLAPSRIVDEGWHALILHTAAYAQLCAELGAADGFVHHYPGADPTNWDPEIIDRTRASIRALGYEDDAELWGPPSDETLASVAASCQHSGDCTIIITPKKPGGVV